MIAAILIVVVFLLVMVTAYIVSLPGEEDELEPLERDIPFSDEDAQALSAGRVIHPPHEPRL